MKDMVYADMSKMTSNCVLLKKRKRWNLQTSGHSATLGSQAVNLIPFSGSILVAQTGIRTEGIAPNNVLKD